MFLPLHAYGITVDDIIGVPIPDSSIALPGMDESPEEGVMSILTSIQDILLMVVLPLVVIGAALYIATLLFTAQGDETQMKQAWKALAYTAGALMAIALAYVAVSLISNLNF